MTLNRSKIFNVFFHFRHYARIDKKTIIAMRLCIMAALHLGVRS